MTDAREKVKTLESVIKEKKELRRQLQVYRKATPLYDEYKQIKRKSKQEDFYRAHESDFILRESALRYFKSHDIKKLPAAKTLTAEIEDLISQENEAYVLHELVKAIYVDAPDKSSGKRRQHIHIQYDGLGFIPLNELLASEKA